MQSPEHKKIFVTLTGPSGVGKTTLIRQILAMSSDYEYVQPYTTRELRENETDKISVTEAVFEGMERQGYFLVTNTLFGYKYGTPLVTINTILRNGKIPILDYQLSNITNLESALYTLLNIYIRPSSLEQWRQRLIASGQYTEERFNLGSDELSNIHDNEMQDIYATVINNENEVEATARSIMTVVDTYLRDNQ